MNLNLYPELLERMAAAYALGTLRGGARRRFETLAREHATVRAAVLVWQGRWAGLTELQPSEAPPPEVWLRIQNLVQAEKEREALRARRAAGQARPAASDTAGGWLRSLLLWRGVAAAGAIATVAAVVVGAGVQQRLRVESGAQIAELRQQLAATPQVRYVAVLADDQSAPSMLVTFDASKNALVLQRVGGYRESSDKSLQLWALPPGGGPRSLGVLDGQTVLTLPAPESAVQGVPALAISLEPHGGVPGDRGPTGPVLFKGALIERMT
ncbi:anti-sigma-K factor RskA [Paracidovorax anthurii]|uniref:Anti-sigma-K factor RskA n=1 Tax=Paracidovorax anthurii TaxID=78229 RepID=A0A328YKW1_9BURK|nr:anti-sigma factor [Paracidovorax anthurii]RAR72732.1 anti-sigma-K factor RskA [Paracidovorax anthurii]